MLDRREGSMHGGAMSAKEGAPAASSASDSAESGPRPLITIAMRHYNNAPFVKTALESAFAQTYSPIDIVFIDDASTDNGFEIAQAMAAGYHGPHRLILARNEKNVGLGEQNIRILKLSPGEIIVFADADDISLPNRCQRVYETLRDGGPTLLGVGCFFDFIDLEGRKIDLPPDTVSAREPDSLWTAENLAREAAGPQGAASAHRRWVYDAGVSLSGLRQGDDMVIAFRCLLLGRLSAVPEVLVRRRVHLDNMSGPIRYSWKGKELRAWFRRYLREKVLVSGFMYRDLDKFAREGRMPRARAEALARVVDQYTRQIKLLRVAPQLSFWRRWTLYFGLRRVGVAPRRSLRLTLQVLAPSLAMYFLRRNPIFAKRKEMERT
jgi:glycosyltransferase involved in cell wall biosynthesis